MTGSGVPGLHGRLSVQIVVLVLVCALVPLGITTYVAVGESQDALEEQTTQQLETEIEGVVTNAEDRTEAYEAQIYQVRDHPSVAELVGLRYGNATIDERVDEFERGAAYPQLLGGTEAYQETIAFFDLISQQDPNIEAVRIFWADGNLVAGHERYEVLEGRTVGQELEAQYRDEDRWFEEVMDETATDPDEVYISNINLARSTDSPVVRYAMPIEVDGERVATIVINYEATQITEPAEELEIGDRGYGALVSPNYVDAEGEELGAAFVAHARFPGIAFDEEDAGDIYIPTDELDDESGAFAYEYNDLTWHAEYERIEIGGEEYYAIATVPEEQMLAPVVTIRNLGLLVAGGSAIFVVGIGLVATRRLTKPIRHITDDASAVADGDLDREITTSGVNREVQQLGDAIGNMKANVVDALEDARQQREAAEDARAESEALAEELQKQAEAFGDAIERAADGDLTVRLDTDIDNEAMREIAGSFNAMLADLETTVADLQTFATEVAATSKQVTASTDEVSDASADVSSSVQEIADGAADQNDQLQKVAQEMEQLSAMVEEVAGQANTVAETAADTAHIGEQGRAAATDAIDEMEAIEEFAAQAVEAVETLEARFEEIIETTDLIADLAEETNMLALNANVEAARTDTSGEGFGVVADEVKALAEESRQSAAEIEATIEATYDQMETAAKSVRQARERIDEGTATVAEAVDAFDEVVDNVEATNDGIQEIDAATDDQADSVQEVAAIVDDVANIAEETTAEAESASAAAEEQAASLDEVLRSTHDLADQAADLQDRLETFETESVDEPRSRVEP